MDVDIFIASVAMSPVVKATTHNLLTLAAQTAADCLTGRDPTVIDAIYVGNMLGGKSSCQRLLGSMIADRVGCRRAEAYRIESACGSGGAAVRNAFLAIKSGEVKNALVIGVEIMSTISKDDITRELATASDWCREGSQGQSFVSLNSQLMTAYIDRYGVAAEDFAIFPLNAHRNAMTVEHALFRKGLSETDYRQSKILDQHLRLMDASPICDGCAALYLTSDRGLAAADGAVIRIRASASASQQAALSCKSDILAMPAIRDSTSKAFALAGITRDAVDFFETHDAYSIMSALSLEGAGFARPGTALSVARDRGLGPAEGLPVSTMGGLKARGHAVGATGVYQMAEGFLQVAHAAGANQVPGARLGMVQNIGGCGSFVTTNIIERMSS